MILLHAGTTYVGSYRLLTFAWEWACAPKCLQLATTELDTEYCALCPKHDLTALHLLNQNVEHLSEVRGAMLMLLAYTTGMSVQ